MPLHRLAPLLLAFLAAAPLRAGEGTGWPVTEGAPGGGRYSPLADIRADNVASLREVWRYRHGDFFAGRFPVQDQRIDADDRRAQVLLGADDRHLRFRSCVDVVLHDDGSASVTLGGTSEEATFTGTLTGNVMRGTIQIVGHPNGTFLGTRPGAENRGPGRPGGQRPPSE